MGGFQLLVIISKDSINIVENVCVLYVGVSFGYICSSVITGSSGRTISNFLSNQQVDFQSDCTSLQSHQKWRSVPLFLQPQPLLSPEFLILAILTGVR